MFKRTESYALSSDLNPLRYIENTELAGLDLANSTLLYMLDKETEYLEYTITRYERRIDLISIDIYGSSDYSWIVMYTNRIKISELVRGVKLKYIPINRLQVILSSI